MKFPPEEEEAPFKFTVYIHLRGYSFEMKDCTSFCLYNSIFGPELGLRSPAFIKIIRQAKHAAAESEGLS